MWCGWTFRGGVKIIFASWVNFNRGQGGGEVDEEEKEGEEEGGLCLRSCSTHEDFVVENGGGGEERMRRRRRRGDSVHWKNWWISAGLQIYVQALGNFRDSETPSRQFWNPIHYLSVTSGIWELSIKFFCHSRWHVSKWILCKEKTIAIRSMYRGIFQYRDVPVFRIFRVVSFH